MLEYSVNNQSDKKVTLKIEIDDHDYKEGHLKEPELRVVDNSHSEWEWWCDQGRAVRPSSWNNVRSAKNEVSLDPRQELTLLLIF